MTQLTPNWPQVDPKLAPSWPQLPQVSPKLAHVGPSWSKLVQIGPKVVNFADVGSCWSQVGPMLAHLPRCCQGVHEGSDSKALVLQYVHEGSASGVPTFGCSFGLFRRLAFALKGCFFLVLLSACNVMAGLSKRCIQTFLSSSSCRQLFLEDSSFFVHCTKAL